MQGILYIAHGSRDPETIREVRNFLEPVMKKISVPLQQLCFLELAKPDIEEGVRMLTGRGADRIAAVPLLLLGAGHYYKDIPESLKKMKEFYPDVTFMYGAPLGVRESLVDILIEHIDELGIRLTGEEKIMLVGRGSSHPGPKRDMEKIKRIFVEKTNYKNIELCYLGGCRPFFEERWQQVRNEESTPVMIVPYLWFTGFLLKRLKKKIAEANQQSPRFYITKQLGSHPNVQKVCLDRIDEVLSGMGEIID